MPYIELHTSSAFSFLDGASLPGTLVERAAELGYPALALLDRDGLYGAPQFYRAAKAAGIKAIVGAELTIGASCQAQGPGPGPGDDLPGRPAKARSETWAWAFSWPAPGHCLCSSPAPRAIGISAASSRARSCARPRASRRSTLDDFAGQTAGLIALVGRQALHAERHGVGGLVDRLVGIFGRQQVVDRSAASLSPRRAGRSAVAARSGARRFACRSWRRTACASPRRRRGRSTTCFTCIRHKTTLARAGRLLVGQRRAVSEAAGDDGAAVFGSAAGAGRHRSAGRAARVHARESRLPVSRVSRCRRGRRRRRFSAGSTQVGARDRYRPYHDRARAQIARELDLIERLDLAGYFLIVWDLVNFCRQQGILVQGRGSAANSAVCYALGITAVDPVGHGSAVRAVSVGGARRVAGHRSRSAERRSARARHSVRLRALRQARRGDDRQRHHLSRPERRARSRQGARPRARTRSIGWRG